MKEINKTKVSVPAPPKARANRAQFLADIPTAQAPSHNLNQPSTNRSADMNFKVSDEFHRAFKSAASIMGISMKEVLEEAFQLWQEKNELQHVTRDVVAGVVQQRSRARVMSGKNKPPRSGRRVRPPDPQKPDFFRGE